MRLLKGVCFHRMLVSFYLFALILIDVAAYILISLNVGGRQPVACSISKTLLRPSLAMQPGKEDWTATAPCLAQGNSFRAQYKGGTFVAKGDDGRIFVTSDTIQLAMKQGERLEILPHNVTGLSYGTEASRRVALWVTLGIVLTPVALFGLFAKRKNHYIGIEYKDSAGKAGAVMIRADKKEYMPLLASLRSVTGKKISRVSASSSVQRIRPFGEVREDNGIPRTFNSYTVR